MLQVVDIVEDQLSLFLAEHIGQHKPSLQPLFAFDEAVLDCYLFHSYCFFTTMGTLVHNRRHNRRLNNCYAKLRKGFVKVRKELFVALCAFFVKLSVIAFSLNPEKQKKYPVGQRINMNNMV